MATRLYALGPNEQLENVVEGVGSAASSKIVNLTIDLSTSAVNEGTTTRGILKNEVLICLEIYQQYIVRSNWPPA